MKDGGLYVYLNNFGDVFVVRVHWVILINIKIYL